MSCNCRQSVEEVVAQQRKQARIDEEQAETRLESFREGIGEGAKEVTARHLYRAGVYLASLNLGAERRVDRGSVRQALESQQSSIDPEVRQFYGSNRPLVEEQGRYVDSEAMLQRITRQGEKAGSLLKASAERELIQAKVALNRMKRLEERLKSWREGLRFQTRVEMLQIVERHS